MNLPLAKITRKSIISLRFYFYLHSSAFSERFRLVALRFMSSKHTCPDYRQLLNGCGRIDRHENRAAEPYPFHAPFKEYVDPVPAEPQRVAHLPGGAYRPLGDIVFQKCSILLTGLLNSAAIPGPSNGSVNLSFIQKPTTDK